MSGRVSWLAAAVALVVAGCGTATSRSVPAQPLGATARVGQWEVTVVSSRETPRIDEYHQEALAADAGADSAFLVVKIKARNAGDKKADFAAEMRSRLRVRDADRYQYPVDTYGQAALKAAFVSRAIAPGETEIGEWAFRVRSELPRPQLVVNWETGPLLWDLAARR